MRSFGFSLIELMIVLAIIGILAVIALPSYQTYTQRARFVEVVSVAGIYKTAVGLAIQEGVTTEELVNGKHGIPDSPRITKHVASVIVENGVITATATSLLKDATYILTPTDDGNVWLVSGTCLKYRLCHD